MYLPKFNILPVPSDLRPRFCFQKNRLGLKKKFNYPKYAYDQLGPEEIFYQWMNATYPFKTTNYDSSSDLDYIPVYWTKVILMHGMDFAKSCLQDLYAEYNSAKPKLLIVQHDCADELLSCIKHEHLIGAVCSRTTRSSRLVDIPLLASPSIDSLVLPAQHKKYLSNFIGRITHPIRQELYSQISSAESDLHFIKITNSMDPKLYAKVLSSSRFTFCPRGYGGSSFRFWEALALGSIPVLIGDLDTRPKYPINPDSYSMYYDSAEKAFKEVCMMPEDYIINLRKNGLLAWKKYYKSEQFARTLITHLPSLIS